MLSSPWWAQREESLRESSISKVRVGTVLYRDYSKIGSMFIHSRDFFLLCRASERSGAGSCTPHGRPLRGRGNSFFLFFSSLLYTCLLYTQHLFIVFSFQAKESRGSGAERFCKGFS